MIRGSGKSPASTAAGRPLRLGAPVWLGRRSAATRSYPTLGSHREADVVVVGGGMTGAAVAAAFSAAGVEVVVLEAALVGRGSTAASTALLLQEPDVGLSDLGRRYGAAKARRIWRLSTRAVRDLVKT